MKKLFLGMAFGVIGTFAMAQQTQPTMKADKIDHAQNLEIRHQKKLEKMKVELNLTDQQVSKIKDMQQKNMAERKARMTSDKRVALSKADMKNMKMEKRADANTEMKQILTPEQYTKWEMHMKQRMERNKERKMKMKGNKMNMRKKGTAMQKMETN